MDLQLPDISGIEAIIAIRSEFPAARIIVLTTYCGDIQVVRALKAGARAFVLKGHVLDELLDTIRAVHAGKKRIPPDVAASTDALALLRFGAANGFFIAAVTGLVRTVLGKHR